MKINTKTRYGNPKWGSQCYNRRMPAIHNREAGHAMRKTIMSAAIGAIGMGAVIPLSAQSVPGWKTDFSRFTVPLDEIVSGGPPKDGIPAIDNPTFEDVRRADRWLKDREPVVLVDLDGVAKAYPLRILIQHEIVNDAVGRVPVSITYCPLCNTALTFDRRFQGLLLDFGTTGNLRYSDLIMYDRQTETWWQQATGEGIVGRFAGEWLTFVSSPLVSWKTFKTQYPDGLVLSRDTGFDRTYDRNPYVGYDERPGPWRSFFDRTPDNRLHPMERVVALDIGAESLAFPFESLKRKRVINHRVGERRFVVFWVPGTSSAVNATTIAGGQDVGSSTVFDRQIGSRTLTFEAVEDDHFRDRETGTVWNALGFAVSGPLADKQLTAIPHGNHFWFAWAAFKTDVQLIK